MLRTIVRFTPTFTLPIIGSSNNKNDYNMLEAPLPESPTTGWQRVKKMYSKQDEEVSVELQNVAQSAMCGAFIGACMGGFVGSRNAYLYFIENNQATIFNTTMDAKKKLQNYVTVAFAKGAVRWGWRLSIFSGIFSIIANTVSVYRDDTSLVEFITAGAITGGIYKLNLGLAATLVGAGLGAVLATVSGLLILGLLKLTGVTMADIKRSLYKVKEAREDQLNQAIEKAATIKNDSLTRHHDSLVQEQGEQKIEHLTNV